MPAKKSTRVEKPARKKKTQPSRGVSPKALLLVAAGVMAGGILIAARQQTPPPLATTPRQELVPMPEVRAHGGGTSAAAGTPASGTSAVPKAPAVTVTGCLVRADDTFRLKDTAGADAPKARSWKSGFLKKGSASFEVVDPVHALNMASHVGQRVSVTGTLADHEMQARSLRRVNGSCAH